MYAIRSYYGTAIQEIQHGTAKNIGNVENSARTIEQANDLASRSGQALEGILEQVRLVETRNNFV